MGIRGPTRSHLFYFRSAKATRSGRVGYLKAPTDFLPWLAGGWRPSLREDWDRATKRAFISRIAPLYRRRGTDVGWKMSCASSCPMWTSSSPKTKSRPHYFRVVVTVPDSRSILLARRVPHGPCLVDRGQPAHFRSMACSSGTRPCRSATIPTGIGAWHGADLGADPRSIPNRTTILGTRDHLAR